MEYDKDYLISQDIYRDILDDDNIRLLLSCIVASNGSILDVLMDQLPLYPNSPKVFHYILQYVPQNKKELIAIYYPEINNMEDIINEDNIDTLLNDLPEQSHHREVLLNNYSHLLN